MSLAAETILWKDRQNNQSFNYINNTYSIIHSHISCSDRKEALEGNPVIAAVNDYLHTANLSLMNQFKAAVWLTSYSTNESLRDNDLKASQTEKRTGWGGMSRGYRNTPTVSSSLLWINGIFLMLQWCQNDPISIAFQIQIKPRHRFVSPGFGMLLSEVTSWWNTPWTPHSISFNTFIILRWKLPLQYHT